MSVVYCDSDNTMDHTYERSVKRERKNEMKAPSTYDVSYYIANKTAKGGRAIVLGTMGLLKGLVKGSVDGARGSTSSPQVGSTASTTTPDFAEFVKEMVETVKSEA